MTRVSLRPTRRDAVLLLLGGVSFLAFSRLMNPPIQAQTPILPHLHGDSNNIISLPDEFDEPSFPTTYPPTLLPQPTGSSEVSASAPVRWNRKPGDPLPYTRIVDHAPGWTLFENLYMSNGTWYVVKSGATTPEDEGWSSMEPPELRKILSSGLVSLNEPGNIAAREPGPEHMSFISLEEANERWRSKAWGVEGVSWIFNDPPQFLTHYYHMVAETFLGMWSFFAGVMDSHITDHGETTMRMPSRAIFLRCTPDEWRDSSKFNGYFFRAAFPSINIEVNRDWDDRVFMTRDGGSAFLFETVLLSDRSASFRGDNCGKNHRIASEAYEYVRGRTSKWWWEPVRRAVLTFAGVPESVLDLAIRFPKLPPPVSTSTPTPNPPPRDQPIVITYINRQAGRRHLIQEDHEGLVTSLTDLARRKGWEFNNVQAEKLSKEEQLQMVAKTTVLIGVHGNGLTHLIMMPPTEVSTVIEIFYPGGFAHDYEWTTRAMGMKHFAVWNDTWATHPNTHRVDYPDGFQGESIPVHGPAMAKLIEDRIGGRLP